MMRIALAAGWPFAGLLALDAVRAADSSAPTVRGLIVRNDDTARVLVLESDAVARPLTTDAVTGFYGVDGYPIDCGDIQVGDMVEAVQQKNGEEWVTTKVRILGPAPCPGRGTD